MKRNCYYSLSIFFSCGNPFMLKMSELWAPKIGSTLLGVDYGVKVIHEFREDNQNLIVYIASLKKLELFLTRFRQVIPTWIWIFQALFFLQHRGRGWYNGKIDWNKLHGCGDGFYMGNSYVIKNEESKLERATLKKTLSFFPVKTSPC